MVNRPAGGARSQRWEKSDYDWYIEPEWTIDRLMERVDFAQDVIYDPTCGRGTILDVAKRRGHDTIGSDIIDRKPRHRFMRGNILLLNEPPKTQGRPLSVICNPPYSYEEDIAERIIRKVITALPVRIAAFLLPIAFLCSNGRWRFFEKDLKPAEIAVLSERPSMPPGGMVDEFTTFKGGMSDYVWIIYRPPHRWRTETIWLRPSDEPDFGN